MAKRSKSKKNGSGLAGNGNARPSQVRKSGLKRRKQKHVALHEVPDQLDQARRHFMASKSIAGAARSTGISPGKLRRLIRNFKLANWDKSKRRWRITDRQIREIVAISSKGQRKIRVRGFGPASIAMRHRAAVHQFLETNDAALLAPFKDVSLTDTAKQKHLLETRPNVLYRIANAGNDADMKIYRLI